MKANKEKLDIIFNYYTQNELAITLGITQWKLLQKMQNDDFTQVEINDIDHIFEKEIKESKEYIHDVFMGKIKIPQDILDNSFEKTKEKIQKWIPEVNGNCLEKNCKEKATKDYNQHGHYVCDYHYEKINDEFDEDYR